MGALRHPSEASPTIKVLLEYSQIARRQAELELQTLRNMPSANPFVASPQCPAPDSATEMDESEDVSGEDLTASRRSSLLRSLTAAMEQWRLADGCQVSS